MLKVPETNEMPAVIDAAVGEAVEITTINAEGGVQVDVVNDSIPDPTGEFNPNIDLLIKILSWIRPHDTMHEQAFVEWIAQYVIKLDSRNQLLFTTSPDGKDALKSLVVTIATSEGKKSKTLFSCHTDTQHAHWLGNGKDQTQQLNYDPNFGQIFLAQADQRHGYVLGADDGVGVWIMLEMIRANVPGSYFFHRGEEKGCLGSKHLAAKYQLQLRRFKRAIAFDRPRCNEIITHQRSRRGCSDEFAKALADELNDLGGTVLKFAPSDKGVYTDTAEYFSLIAECTNIGVGYEDQHSKDEFLDVGHAVALLTAAVDVDWEGLPTRRDPKKDEYKQTPYKGNASYGTGGLFGHDTLDDYENWQTKRNGWMNKTDPRKPAPPAPAVAPAPAPYTPGAYNRGDKIPKDTHDLLAYTPEELATFVKQYPHSAYRFMAILIGTVKANLVEIAHLKRFLTGNDKGTS